MTIQIIKIEDDYKIIHSHKGGFCEEILIDRVELKVLRNEIKRRAGF